MTTRLLLVALTVLAAAPAAGVSLVMPKLGQSIEPSSPPPVDPWWRAVSAR